jgi:hypothetical protein
MKMVRIFEIIEDNGDIILDVSEINAFFGNNNFEVEVYMEEEKVENGETITTSTPLFFRKRKQLVKRQRILIDYDADQDASVLYSALLASLTIPMALWEN